MASEHLNRRAFARRIAAGAAAPLIAAGAGCDAAAQAQKPDETKPPSLVEKMLELIRQQYPDQRLDAPAIAEIREALESQIAKSTRLSSFPLSNADEPGFQFKAYRKEGEER